MGDKNIKMIKESLDKLENVVIPEEIMTHIATTREVSKK